MKRPSRLWLGSHQFYKTLENPNFLRKGKMVVSVKKIQKFFQISDDETDFTVDIVLRNLATT